ncbi:MAG: formylglycine-generating enzyme family protein [Desulfobulbaceae bacterium]|nr:formylglycine-generating enzyme family protein [Desulfobulbaceae bacterium]
MEEINEVQAGELITAIKFNEMIEKINKIDEIYLEINKINNMCTEINKNIEILEKKIDMKFTLILAGTFTMGSGINDNSLPNNEKPDHAVTISKPFYLGTYPVTQHEWKAVMGMDPSGFEGNDLPIQRVSWNDVQEFVTKLNEMEGTNKYRLPSEAEWEYACRAGTSSQYSFDDDVSTLGEYVWYGDNSDTKPHSVGRKKPNPWGLYDMHGNVWEWVQDKWHGNYNGAPDDGSAWEDEDGSHRVYRGGCWYFSAMDCRSASRNHFVPDDAYHSLGFRLLREL